MGVWSLSKQFDVFALGSKRKQLYITCHEFQFITLIQSTTESHQVVKDITSTLGCEKEKQ